MIKTTIRRSKKVFFHLGKNKFKKSLLVPIEQVKHVQIEPTIRCNFQCLTCSRPMDMAKTHEKVDLEPEEMEQILRTLPSLQTIKLQGLGEPFLHPNFEDILKKVQEKNIKIWLISHGGLLRKPNVRNLVHNYLTDFTVSIDSADPDNFVKIRPGGSTLPQILEGLEALIEERDSGMSDVLIGVNATISKMNLHEMEDIARLCMDLNVDYLSFANAENWLIQGDVGHEESLKYIDSSQEFLDQVNKKVGRLRLKLLSKGIILGHKTSSKRFGKCNWPFDSMYITVNGLTTPCCIRSKAETHSLFNILSGQPIDELWNGGKYQELRKAHIEGDETNKMCGSCPF